MGAALILWLKPALHRAARTAHHLAMPVVPHTFVPRGRAAFYEFVYLPAPRGFAAVGQSYRDFRPVQDDEVVRLLAKAARRELPR